MHVPVSDSQDWSIMKEDYVSWSSVSPDYSCGRRNIYFCAHQFPVFSFMDESLQTWGDLRLFETLSTHFEVAISFPSYKWQAEQNLPKLDPICTTSCRNYLNILACGCSNFLFPVQVQSFTWYVSGKRLYTHIHTHLWGDRVLNVWDKNHNFETKIKQSFLGFLHDYDI